MHMSFKLNTKLKNSRITDSKEKKVKRKSIQTKLQLKRKDEDYETSCVDKILSNILKIFNEEKNDGSNYILGIDEAGRGPVIGPMIYAGLLLKKEDVTNYKDSKMLSKKQREDFYEKIKNENIFFVFEISPSLISECMLSEMNKGGMLDTLSRHAIIQIIQNSCKKFNVEKIFIDKISKKGFDNFLSKMVNKTVIIEEKADSKYQCVSGASIVAKVMRDECINSSIMGSGYPSDFNTKKYLKSTFKPIFGWNEEIRYSWGTVLDFFDKYEGKNNLHKYKTIFL